MLFLRRKQRRNKTKSRRKRLRENWFFPIFFIFQFKKKSPIPLELIISNNSLFINKIHSKEHRILNQNINIWLNLSARNMQYQNRIWIWIIEVKKNGWKFWFKKGGDPLSTTSDSSLVLALISESGQIVLIQAPNFWLKLWSLISVLQKFMIQCFIIYLENLFNNWVSISEFVQFSGCLCCIFESLNGKSSI